MATILEQAHAALRDVVAFYQQHGCPCAYPRFVQLVSFDFRRYTTSPVGWHLQDILIGLVACGDAPYYPATGAWEGPTRAHTCPACGSRVVLCDEEFSINMRCSRLAFPAGARARLRGLPAEKLPVPEGGGFFGFKRDNIDACRAALTVPGTFEETAAYLKALDLTWPPRPAPAQQP